MRWSLILKLSLVGVLFAALTIAGWIHGWESRIAPGLLLLLAAIVALRVDARPTRHGFVAGFLAAFVAIELQALFLPIYFSNNPGYDQIEIPFGWPARLATAVLGPINALLAGVVCAALTWILSKLVKRWRGIG